MAGLVEPYIRTDARDAGGCNLAVWVPEEIPQRTKLMQVDGLPGLQRQ